MQLHASTSFLAFALATIVQAIEPARQPRQPIGGGTQLLNFTNTVVKPAFKASTTTLNWLEGAEDGTAVYTGTDGSLLLTNYANGKNTTFVAADKMPASDDLHEYWISGDMSRVLLATNYTKLYRHSYYADYETLGVATGQRTPLTDTQDGRTQYAQFSPSGTLVTFVRGNNLYVKNLETGQTSQITDDGGPDKANGVPDWVYEEEVFGDRYTLWFSPDSKFLAFLSFNETGVGTSTIQYYMNDHRETAPPYPRDLDLRYPKAGTTNPTVQLSLLDLSTLQLTPVAVDAFPPDDLIIGEVVWTTSQHDSFVFRAQNRVQTQEKVITVSVPSAQSTVHRERDGEDGWVDNRLAIQYVGSRTGNCSTTPVDNSTDQTYYADISDESGWAHIYLYPVNGPASNKIGLTSGEWEVRSILAVDINRKYIYYTSTEFSSIDSHLYRVSYATGSPQREALVDDSVPGSWSASFSAEKGYYLLDYRGPDVPYQELYAVNSTKPLQTITTNEALYKKLQGFRLPNITYMEIGPVPGTNYTLNVQVMLPANFDPSKTYPAFLTPYGGPGAQQVTRSYFAPRFNHFVASDPELEYILYTVDNRGTGYKGRTFRSTVAKNLGDLEAQDQIWAARYLAETYDYVDASHIALWGWSYGGYLTAKTIEAQGNDTGPFTLGLITAPVTDWRLYDSVYTDRYMRTPATNPKGYNKSRVHDVSGFKTIPGGFAVMHGLGDDNVHYQNTAAMIDWLVSSDVGPEQMDWRAYTDSDHSIQYNGANIDLFKFLAKKLWDEKNRGKAPTLRHQWSRRTENPFA